MTDEILSMGTGAHFPPHPESVWRADHAHTGEHRVAIEDGEGNRDVAHWQSLPDCGGDGCGYGDEIQENINKYAEKM